MKNLGCHGGYPIDALEYIQRYNITDETCSNYQAQGHENGLECTKDVLCKDCVPGADFGGKGGCSVPSEYYTYTIEESGHLKGEAEMIDELQRGPIICGIAATDDLYFNYTGGIYKDTTNATEVDHAISVVGYGVEKGVKYWMIRNSWGSFWGENGFFRLVRGTNNLAIESDC